MLFHMRQKSRAARALRAIVKHGQSLHLPLRSPLLEVSHLFRATHLKVAQSSKQAAGGRHLRNEDTPHLPRLCTNQFAPRWTLSKEWPSQPIVSFLLIQRIFLVYQLRRATIDDVCVAKPHMAPIDPDGLGFKPSSRPSERPTRARPRSLHSALLCV